MARFAAMWFLIGLAVLLLLVVGALLIGGITRRPGDDMEAEASDLRRADDGRDESGSTDFLNPMG